MWGVAILVLSGELGSSANTLSLIRQVVAFFAALSPDELNALHVFLRKVGHVSAYGLLYLLFFRALKLHLTGRPWLTCLAAMTLSTLVAGLDEGCQALSPSRHGSVADVLLDFSGIVLAALLIPGLWRPESRESAAIVPTPTPEKLGPHP